jgi:hypothetical protein
MGPGVGATAAAFRRNSDLLDHVDYRLAETPEDKDEIYRLRYRAYLREGAIVQSESQRLSDHYDDAPNAWIFGVYLYGQLCSSIRVSVVTPEWRTSPAVEVFGETLQPELDKGRIFVDPTRFVADPEKARLFPELPYATVRLGYVAGVHFNADVGLASVRPEHQAFYRRLFLQETWGEPRFYPGLVKPVALMAAHYPAMRDKVFARYPFLHSSAFERRMLFERDGQRRPFSPKVIASRFEQASIVPQQS